jgi:hypothetical protein
LVAFHDEAQLVRAFFHFERREDRQFEHWICVFGDAENCRAFRIVGRPNVAHERRGAPEDEPGQAWRVCENSLALSDKWFGRQVHRVDLRIRPEIE